MKILGVREDGGGDGVLFRISGKGGGDMDEDLLDSGLNVGAGLLVGEVALLMVETTGVDVMLVLVFALVSVVVEFTGEAGLVEFSEFVGGIGGCSGVDGREDFFSLSSSCSKVLTLIIHPSQMNPCIIELKKKIMRNEKNAKKFALLLLFGLQNQCNC